MSETKLINNTLNDFTTEIEMVSSLNFMEKMEMNYMKNYGLLRWKVN